MSAFSSLGFFGKLKAFTDNIFQLPLHVFFAGFWSLSLLGNLHVLSSPHQWTWQPSTLILVGTVFLCLLSLRMVDEVKDYDYDRVFNPSRPLVSGLVNLGDIKIYCVLIAAVVLGMNSLLSLQLVWVLAIDLLYGLAQIPIERHSKTVRDNLFVNLAVVYPVNIGLSLYTLVYFLGSSHAPLSTSHLWLVAAYALAFLHFEIARKSGWPALSQPGERLYSHWIGLPGSLALSSAFGLACLSIVVCLLEPWAHTGLSAWTGYLPLLALLPMAWGLLRQTSQSTTRVAARPPAVAFLFTFYLTLFIHAMATCVINFEGIAPWRF